MESKFDSTPMLDYSGQRSNYDVTRPDRRGTMNEQMSAVRLAGSVLGPSRHVCAFFHNKDEEYGTLLPYIKEGFEQGDRAFHIIDRHRRQDHMRRLQDAGIDLAEAQAEGRLIIRHWEDTYL